MRKNNKGLTLIELVVTIAIIAIFSGVVVSLIGLGSNTYRATSGNAKIQMETQEAADQIQNLIIDANRSVYYAECSVGEGYSFTLGNQIQSDVQESSGGRTGTVSKAFVVCNEQKEGNIITYQYDVIVWDANSHKIIYTSKEANAIADTEENSESGEGAGEPASANAASDFAFSENDATGDGENQANGIMPFSDEESEGGQGTSKIMDSKVVVAPAVLAEDITDFCADTTLVLSDQIVRFQLFTEKSGKKINVLNTVNLRNPIKVAAPDESFGSAAAVDGKISILVPSKPLKPGDVYTFSTYTVGDVDPTTIRWYSKDPDTGFFQSSDLTLGKIFISEDPASNTLTIYVKAKTSSGREITSNEVTITIEKPAAEVTGIEPSQDTVLFGVNTGRNENYSLSNITWDEVYSDGTKKPIDASKIKWSCSGNPYISVDESGNVTVYPTAGDSQNNAVFNVNATYTGENENITGSITVKLARLDIESPSGVYHVGDTKEIKTVYREGGVIIDGIQATVTAAKKNSSGVSFNAGDIFVNDDIGEWNVNAIANTSGRNVNGAVSASGNFSVELETEQKDAYIKLGVKGNGDYDTIFGNGIYYCSYGYSNHFELVVDQADKDSNWWNYSLVWIIEGGEGVTFSGGSKMSESNPQLNIAENATGFYLNAELKYYYRNTDSVACIFTARKKVNVVNRIAIDKPAADATIVNGGTYPLEALVYKSEISGGEGNYSYSTSIVENGTQNAEWTLDATDGGIISGGKWTVSDRITNVKLGVKVSSIEGVVNAYSESILHDERTFDITAPEYNISLREEGQPEEQRETTIKGGDSVKLIADLVIGDKNIEDLTWECTGPTGNNLIDNYMSPNTGNKRTFKIPEYILKDNDGNFLGTYTVRISYNSPRGDIVYSDEYRIHVTDRDVNLTIADSHGQTSSKIYKDGSVQLNANLLVDGYVPYNYTINWNCVDSNGNTVDNVLSSTTRTQISFNANNSLNSGNYTITASYTYKKLNNQETQVTSNSYTITILDDVIDFNIYEMKNRISVSEGEEVGFWASLKVNGKEITDNSRGEVTWTSTTSSLNDKRTQPGRSNIVKYTTQKTDANKTITVTAQIEGVTEPVSLSVNVTQIRIEIQNKGAVSSGLQAGEKHTFTAKVYNGEDEITNRKYIWSYELVSGDSLQGIAIAQETGELTIPEDLASSCTVRVIVATEDGITSDSVLVNVFPANKEKKAKGPYYVTPNNLQVLEVEEVDQTSRTCNITLTVNYTDTSSEVITDLNNIPGMDISVAFNPLYLQASLEGADSVQHIASYTIVAEMDHSIYTYTVIPKVSNVYNLSGVETGEFVPAPDVAKNYSTVTDEGYSYLWTDEKDRKFYLRKSIRYTTGTYNEYTSLNVWFMKYGENYYKYENKGWYQQSNDVYTGLMGYKVKWDNYWTGTVLIFPYSFYWQKWN